MGNASRTDHQQLLPLVARKETRSLFHFPKPQKNRGRDCRYGTLYARDDTSQDQLYNNDRLSRPPVCMDSLCPKRAAPLGTQIAPSLIRSSPSRRDSDRIRLLGKQRLLNPREPRVQKLFYGRRKIGVPAVKHHPKKS